MRSIAYLPVIGCFFLGMGCSQGESSDPGGATGGSLSGGNSGDNSGGDNTGGDADSNSGGSNSGGSNSGGSGGVPNIFDGYPDWVPGCLQSRTLAPCPSCLSPECLVCAFGTGDEVASAGAECGDAPSPNSVGCTCAPCATGQGLCNQ